MSSYITIQTPKTISTQGQGSLSALPTNRVSCFGINIKGIGPDHSSHPCGPIIGMPVGFVRGGEAIRVTLPKGSTIGIELYIYLLPIGQTGSCPAFLTQLSGAQLTNLYLVGTTNGISLRENETVVNMTAVFPGVANNVTKNIVTNSQCLALTPQTEPQNYGVSSGVQTIIGSNVKIHARAGSAGELKWLTGGNIKVLVK